MPTITNYIWKYDRPTLWSSDLAVWSHMEQVSLTAGRDYLTSLFEMTLINVAFFIFQIP
jgi:hypothetical protein